MGLWLRANPLETLFIFAALCVVASSGLSILDGAGGVAVFSVFQLSAIVLSVAYLQGGRP